MGFENVNLLTRYKTNKNQIVKEFYLPVLKESVIYKRAVGFFTSTALIELSRGLSGLINNGGRIRLIVSPLLDKEDIEAIKRGYEEKEIIERSLIRHFYEPQNDFDAERLNWLAHLISNGYLDIKVAFTPEKVKKGIYHEKIGVMHDKHANVISFTGSANETYYAFNCNYESIEVFNSLIPEDKNRAFELDKDFDSLWNNIEPNITIIDFPKVARDKLLAYKKQTLNLKLDEIEANKIIDSSFIPYAETSVGINRIGIPYIPAGLKLFDYQLSAIEEWTKQHYQGIFDMATGTGKTYTGLAAVTKLFHEVKKLAVIIVCPYQHLVEQWVEDIIKFNLSPVIGYSTSGQRDWKRRLENDIFDYKIGVIDVMCFVTTNATFSSQFVQSNLSKLGKNTLLLIDEAHNFGASRLRELLNNRYQYRLALSATLERHGDEGGTKALYDFFGRKCIEYDLERAIREEKLTPYYYHPVVVYLNDTELNQYRDLSKRLIKYRRKNNYGEWEYTEQGKMLLLKRARLIAGAENKLNSLKKLMLSYVNDTHILVYCGAARLFDDTFDSLPADVEGERQIDAVSKMLGNDLHMKVTHFTSMESAKERELIKQRFADANPYQAIVAIKCLDEGVNIPSIKTAFILASSTNPKEYIQRRGRVLRRYPGKDYAVIYDFVTLPTPIERVNYLSDSSKMERSLIVKEINRLLEFGRISLNPSESDKLIKELSEAYGMDLLKESEVGYE